MRKHVVIPGLLSVAAIIAAAAPKVDVSKLPPPATKQVEFARDIKPIIDASCIQCHGEVRPKSRYRMDSREALIKGGSSGEAAVVVGDSAKSPFVHYIADLVEWLEMPPVEDRETYPKLTPEQIGLVRAWIDQGVKWE